MCNEEEIMVAFVLQEQCAADVEPITLEGGKQFGLSRNSHIAAAFDDTKVKNKYVQFWGEAVTTFILVTQ